MRRPKMRLKLDDIEWMSNFYDTNIQKLVPRLIRCFEIGGDKLKVKKNVYFIDTMRKYQTMKMIV